MATLLPTSQSTSVEAYEDMFKEITRKLYGEESTHGLYPHNTQVAQLASNAGPTIPEGERSFTTLVSDRSLAQLDYDNAVDTTFKTEDHLSTAFGLAALMQNGFPPPGAILNPVNFNMSNNTTKQHTTSNVTGGNDDRWPQADDILSWNSTNKMPSYTAPQKFLKVKPKQEPGVVSESTTNTMVNNNNVNAASNKQPQSSASLQSLTNPTPKRYTCSSCPYSTDRRDLFTRHENIHKEEKPFHCYACLKQFNRADHVKKHFVRMHRELTYDINKTRRNPPKNNFYASSNNNQQQQTQSNGLGQQSTQSISQSTTNNQSSTTNSTLNIPPSFNNQSLQLTGLQATQLLDQQGVAVASGLNGVTITPSQQLPNNVTIKQEKTEKTPKKRGEKRFMCCYCSWSGSDNWGLKRHMNTHTKPYVCLLCDYKAARSERLTTHVLKVHNKKACNKCSFFADDQNQLATHQLEAHPHEQRPSGRNNTNNNNQSVTNNTTNVTNNAVNSTNNGSSATNNLSTGGSGNINNSNAGNVLRSLQNAFVPSATSLNTIQNSAVFGSINSSTIYNNNSTNNSTNNLLNNLNNQANNWRNNLISVTLTPGNGGTTTSSTSGSGQKHGAERLFAYLEADGSDPEDYNRQAAMQALSRNTASVAQDFHNAGGGNEDQPQQMSLLEVITSRLQSYKNSGTSSEDQLQHGLNAATSPSQCSPPASSLLLTNQLQQQQHHTQTGKRRRRRPTKLQPLNNVDNDTNDDDHDNWASKEAVMDNLYRQSINTYINQLQYAEVDDELKITLADFLENNPDISITQIDWDRTVGNKNQRNKIQSETVTAQPETVTTEKRNNRKQVQPRKIEKQEAFCIAALREKHLERMVAPGLVCRLCKQRDLFDSYHTIVSLMLHKRWRHARTLLSCKTCGDQFTKKYKLILHQRLKHKN